jgi:predicted small metal-binding protein
MECKFCGMHVMDGDPEDHPIDEVWKRLCIHVWQHHDETHLGISLKDTMKHGPHLHRKEEEE